MSIQKIAKAMEKIAPKTLAAAWDNTGILIDSFTPESSSRLILLTIDFTLSVLEECINKNIKYVISYHPVIFHPQKHITSELLIKCIQNCISVYSPHTQLDPLMNEYLLQLIGPNPGNFDDIVEKIKTVSGLKQLRTVRTTTRFYKNDGDIQVGVGAAFRNVDQTNSMLITGEMSHHDLLKCKFSGVDVIMMEHSNSERVFMRRLKELLDEENELLGFTVIISEADCDPVEIV